MTSKWSFKNIIAVAFALALIVSGSAQASSLLGLDGDLAPRKAVEQPVGFFDRVSALLLGAWTNLTAVFAEDSTTTPITTTSCDAGWGLDPEGCPR
jgi:hypothetical protein